MDRGGRRPWVGETAGQVKTPRTATRRVGKKEKEGPGYGRARKSRGGGGINLQADAHTRQQPGGPLYSARMLASRKPSVLTSISVELLSFSTLLQLPCSRCDL